MPGFISANLHASLDGSRVINYAQWASERQYQAALHRADVREHMAKSAAIAESWDRHARRCARPTTGERGKGLSS